jgi:hypothetical protein
VLKELLTAEELEIRVLDPALAEHLVGEVVQVLHNGEPRHQSRGQGRPAGPVLVDRPEAFLEEAPVDRTGELHERVARIDDLVEPGPEQVRLPGLASLLGSHDSPRRDPDGSMESCQTAPSKLPGNAPTTHSNRQIRILTEIQNSRPLSVLRVLHGRQISRIRRRKKGDWSLRLAIALMLGWIS